MNYGQAGGATAVAALPATGLNVSLWLLIAAVALIGLGACILRFMPRVEN